MAYHLYPEAQTLFSYVQCTYPDIFEEYQDIIRPHRVQSLYRILQEHLKSVDLQVFNTRPQNIPKFLLEFVKCVRRNLPSPGDAFGIQLTCRITKNDTQDTLDSRHLRDSDNFSPRSYHLQDVDLIYELNLFTSQNQVLELSNRRKYSSIYVKNYTAQSLLQLFPFDSCHFWKGAPHNKGFDFRGYQVYLNTCRFLVVPHDDNCHRLIFCSSARDLTHLLKHLDGSNILAFNDVKYVFKKCGIVSFFFNMVSIIELNLLDRPLHDLIFVTKYQCRTGIPLPLNRDGLAAHPTRSPLEVLSFEAPKKNYTRYCTEEERNTFPVSSSTDKIFFGQQFNEGTGYRFSIMPDNRRRC